MTEPVRDPGRFAVTDEEVQRRAAAEERARVVQARRDRLRALGGLIEAEDVEAIANGRFERSKALCAVRGFARRVSAAGAPTWLVMLGPTSTGKTFAALIWLANEGALYVKEPELVRLSRSYDRDDRKRYERLLSCSRLVVDEIGVEHEHDRARDVMRELADSRKALATIVIGNLSRRQLLTDRADDRIRARLRSFAQLEVVTETGWRRDLGLFPMDDV